MSSMTEKICNFLDLELVTDDTPILDSDSDEEGDFSKKMDGFFEDGELSGIKFFHSSFPTWFRLMWIVCMVIFLGMMIYQLADLIQQFNDNPLSIDINYEYRDNLKMPSILACPHNQMRLTKTMKNGGIEIANLARSLQSGDIEYTQFDKRAAWLMDQWPKDSADLIAHFEEISAYNDTAECTLSGVRVKVAELIRKIDDLGKLYEAPPTVHSVNVSLDEYRQKLVKFNTTILEVGIQSGQGCENLILKTIEPTIIEQTGAVVNLGGNYSRFQDNVATVANEFIVNCRFRDETPILCSRNWTAVDTIWGRCFFLNMTETIVTRAGIDFALSMEFNTAATDAALNSDGGLTLSLIPEGRDPIVVDPIELNPGYNVHLPLRYQEETYYETECSAASLKVTEEYSQAACMLESFLTTAKEHCGCVPSSAINIAEPTCSISQEIGCVQELRNNITIVWNSNACKVGCMEPRYISSMSYATNDAEKNSRDVTKFDKAPPNRYEYLDHLARGIPTNVTGVDFYGEEWRNRTMASVKDYYIQIAADAVLRGQGKPKEPDSQSFRNGFFYQVFNPMFQFFMEEVLYGLFYHGSEYGVWPTQTTKHMMNMSQYLNMTKCRIQDLRFPVPPTFVRNYTAYVTANSLMMYRKDIPGTLKAGKKVLLGRAIDWIDAFVESLETAVDDEKAAGRRDQLGEQLLERALPYRDCLYDPANNCSETTKADGTDDACQSACQEIVEHLAIACEAIVQLRDSSFLVKRYNAELDGIMNVMSKWIEGSARPYYKFLDSEHGWAGYYGHSEVEHAEYLLESWPSWRVFWGDLKDRVNTMHYFIEFMKKQSDPVNQRLIQEAANLTMPPGYDMYYELMPCLLHYDSIWDKMLADEFLKADYTNRAVKVYNRAVDYLQLSKAGPQYFRENVMSATIYMAELKVKLQEQRLAYDFWSMLSDIGGTISFYIGGTIITFFEIIFMCTNCHKKRKLKIRVRRKKNHAVAKMGAVAAFNMAGKKTLGGGTNSRTTSNDNGAVDNPRLGTIYSPRVPNRAGAALLKKLKEDPSIADEAKSVVGNGATATGNGAPEKPNKAAYVPRTPNKVGSLLIQKLKDCPELADEAKMVIGNENGSHAQAPKRPETAVIVVGEDEPPRYDAVM